MWSFQIQNPDIFSEILSGPYWESGQTPKDFPEQDIPPDKTPDLWYD